MLLPDSKLGALVFHTQNMNAYFLNPHRIKTPVILTKRCDHYTIIMALCMALSVF